MASSVPKLRSRRIACGLSARNNELSVMTKWSLVRPLGGIPARLGSSTRRIVFGQPRVSVYAAWRQPGLSMTRCGRGAAHLPLYVKLLRSVSRATSAYASSVVDGIVQTRGPALVDSGARGPAGVCSLLASRFLRSMMWLSSVAASSTIAVQSPRCHR